MQALIRKIAFVILSGASTTACDRLDVHQHIGDARISLLNSALYLVSDVMSLTHGDAAVHFNVKIDIKIEAHLSNQTLVDVSHASHRCGGFAHRFSDSAARSGIENIIERGTEQPHTNRTDDDANKNRRPVICGLPPFTAN